MIGVMMTSTVPEVLNHAALMCRLGITSWQLRCAMKLGLIPYHGRVGRSNVVYASEVPAIEEALRLAGIIQDPDCPAPDSFTLARETARERLRQESEGAP